MVVSRLVGARAAFGVGPNHLFLGDAEDLFNPLSQLAAGPTVPQLDQVKVTKGGPYLSRLLSQNII